MIKRIKTSEMKEFDLQAPHVSCLYYLYISNEPLTATELCEMCDEDKAYISRAIDSLEKEGCIVCESKTEKRYKSPLMLTEKGRDIAEKISEKIDGIVGKASLGLSEENREIFYRSLMLISDKWLCFYLQKFHLKVLSQELLQFFLDSQKTHSGIYIHLEPNYEALVLILTNRFYTLLFAIYLQNKHHLHIVFAVE